MERRRDARRAAAPVVAAHGEARQPQRVGEVDDVLADRGLLGHARRGRIEEAGRPVAAQVDREARDSLPRPAAAPPRRRRARRRGSRAAGRRGIPRTDRSRDSRFRAPACARSSLPRRRRPGRAGAPRCDAAAAALVARNCRRFMTGQYPGRAEPVHRAGRNRPQNATPMLMRSVGMYFRSKACVVGAEEALQAEPRAEVEVLVQQPAAVGVEADRRRSARSSGNPRQSRLDAERAALEGATAGVVADEHVAVDVAPSRGRPAPAVVASRRWRSIRRRRR